MVKVSNGRNTKGRAVLAKRGISRAFKILCMDPADAFKFGIKWEGRYYLERAVAFGWVHSSAAFQMSSDAIIHIMTKENCQLFAYNDDFILMSQENETDHHFERLSAMFTELVLPINTDKRSPLLGPSPGQELPLPYITTHSLLIRIS